MKYIDADKIRTEIKRLKAENNCGTDEFIAAKDIAYDKVFDFLENLEEPEQPTMGYDEAYLNEKIAKASKSWEGVDVDKFMDEVRGREPVSDCHDLTEAAEAYSRQVSRGHNYRDLTCGFIAGAEWMKTKMMEGATYNELMELYRAIRDELVKRHRDVPVNIKEEL